MQVETALGAGKAGIARALAVKGNGST